MRSPSSLLVPSYLPTISLFSFPENFHPRPRGRGSPQLDFPHFAYFLLHSLPLHLRVSAVARILSSGLSPHTTVATFALFFQYDGFLRSVRVDFFLIRSRIRVHPPCIKVSSRSSSFFYHDNVPGYFRVYLSHSLFFLFYHYHIFPYLFFRMISVCTSHILVSFHVSSCAFLE